MILVARMMEEDGRMEFDALDMYHGDMLCGICIW